MTTTDATVAVIDRLRRRVDDIAREAVARFRREIVDYANVDDEFLFGEVLAITRHNLLVLFDNLEHGTELQPEQVDLTREGAAKRVHQGISLASIQHAYRLFGEHVWAVILETADVTVAAEREAALAAVEHLLRHMSLVANAGTQAYLDESEGVWSDREIVRRDLLEALLTGRAHEETTRRDARLLELRLHDDYVVVVGRASDVAGDAGTWSTGRRLLRKAAERARERLRTPAGPALVGLREREIVALCPATTPAEHEAVKRAAGATAVALADLGVVVGVGGRHATPAGVPAGYTEAREASVIAARAGIRGRAVAFDEVLIEHVLRSNPQAARLVGDTVAPLREYDARRRSELVATLRAYLDSGLNVSRSAEQLNIHANTVVYRLERIRSLTGRDPRKVDDLILLALGLKLGATQD